MFGITVLTLRKLVSAFTVANRSKPHLVLAYLS